MRFVLSTFIAGIVCSVGPVSIVSADEPCNLAALTNAIQQNPKDVTRYLDRAYCYGRPGPNNQKPPLRKLGAAIKDLETALRLDPRNFAAHHNYAHSAYLLGYDDFAVHEFTKAIALNPRSARSYMGRGFAYLEMCEFRAASPDFQKAVSLDPALRSKVATPQMIATKRNECRIQPAGRSGGGLGPSRNPYFDHSSDYWKQRKWEERPH